MLRRTVGVALVVVATATAAAAQPYVYAVVSPPAIVDSSNLYHLYPPARLYSMDVATGDTTSITLPGTSCYAAAHPDGTRIYAACAKSNGGIVSVIDPATLSVIATTPLPSAPGVIAVSANGSVLVVRSLSALTVLSPTTLAIVGTLNSPDDHVMFVGPLAVTPDGKQAYVGAYHTALVLDTALSIDLQSFKVRKQLWPYSADYGSVYSAAATADGRTLGIARSSSLVLIDTSTDSVTRTVDLTSSAAAAAWPGRTLAFDATGSRAYAPMTALPGTSPDPGGIRVVDPAAGTVVSTLPVGSVTQIAVVSGDRAVVSNASSTRLTVVSLADGAAAASASVSGTIVQVDAAPTGATLLPANENCTYGLTRLHQSFMASMEPNPEDPAGSGIMLGVTAAPDRCAWTGAIDASWLALGTTSGTGSAIVPLTIAPNTSGAARTGHVTVGGQTFTVTQAACNSPTIFIDFPPSNSIITQPFRVGGWALDPCAISGTGMRAGSTTVLSDLPGRGPMLHYGGQRADVAAAYGQQFLHAGFNSDLFAERRPGTTDVEVTFFDESAALNRSAITARATNVTILPSLAPFGVLDTPANGATVSGEMPVTGWALDDVKVSSLKVYRNAVAGEAGDATGRVYIGDATRVSGARPDVAAAFPATPENTLGGFGLMVLTNFLPNGGNGTFTISVDAIDALNQVTTIGSKVVTANNGTSTLPFGTIDTPTQGQTVIGTIVNFGWALTPPPNSIPVDGSTIDVLVDGVVVGHPVYGQYRGDIAALFPGYADSNGAVGYYYLNTTTLTNGVHTIAWVVRDSAGNPNGIGSRYFTVANP